MASLSYKVLRVGFTRNNGVGISDSMLAVGEYRREKKGTVAGGEGDDTVEWDRGLHILSRHSNHFSRNTS